MQTNPEQWAKDLFWAALKAGDHNNYEAAYAVIQAAFAEQNALHTAMEKRARDLSVMLVNHLGGGSEWFSQIGEEYYADPKAIDPELQRRKTDAQITKGALVRANNAIADQAEQNARLVGQWVFPKSINDMPKKLGKEAYEYVECLVMHKGDMIARPWNCEHQVFDDEARDDFFCEWHDVTAYIDLTQARANLAALKDRTDG